MINASANIKNMLISPLRTIKGRVELYAGSTLLNVFNANDALQSFDIARDGEQGKFFGYGISQKLTAKLVDRERSIDVVKGNVLEVAFGVGAEYIYTCPAFTVAEVLRDENTNALTITALDPVGNAAEHTVAELQLGNSYTIREFIIACANLLGLPYSFVGVNSALLDTYYPTGANLDGTETLRQALDDVAEVTGTIYFVSSEWRLTFKKLDVTGEPVLQIDKSKYFNLSAKTSHTLQGIGSLTELGDNIEASNGNAGDAQYFRDNYFLELRADTGAILDALLAEVAGLTLTPFELDWRGNFLLELGDKIAITTKDDNSFTSYLLNNSISYNGALAERASWAYSESKKESAANPSTLGEALKQTYARVDKQGKTIALVVDDVAQLRIDNESITATVASTVDVINNELDVIAKKVEATVTDEDVTIAINKEMEKGTSKVTTSTGFTFDDEGLKITKSGSEISTQITEDGMTVSKGSTEVLIADNKGVKAIDLHAKTYLLIGTNSRFEDYGSNRTGCFWIGG